MKKLINVADNVVMDALWGLAATHLYELDTDLDWHIVYRCRPKEQSKVVIISGGGSEYEPFHGGFAGTGTLNAVRAGEILTFPVLDQMVAVTSAVDCGAGVLYIVKNYTDDAMNFEMAAEIVEAKSGIQVANVVTNDGVAVEDSLYIARRHGAGTTVMAEKIAGVAAEQGHPLGEVAGAAARVNTAGRPTGMALTSCTAPANGEPSFDLSEGEVEIGIGTYGKSGCRREKVASVIEIAERLITPTPAELTALTELESAGAGKDVIVMVSGIGATPPFGLYLMYGEIARLLEGAGITVACNLVGNYIASPDMASRSLALMCVDAEPLSLWDAPVNIPSLC